jgi:chromosome segregation ATPase
MDNYDIITCLKKELDLLTEQNYFLMRENDCLLLEVSNYEKRLDRLNKKYKELEQQNYPNKLAILQEEYTKLQKRCGQKERLINNFASEITDYLNECNSLTETARKFDCSPEELYYCIPEWDDCNERLYGLDDYNIYRNKLEGRCHELDKYDLKKMRTPEQAELELIFTDYKSCNLGLYQIADKYNLLITNLFRLLKEHKLIEKESDAIGYNDFYREYISESIYNKYYIDTDLKLIEMYYRDIKLYNNN